jgi:ubiquinone/menaquinone biosynthesis C-methylase UbiE
MNYERIYQYRFKGIDLQKKKRAWNEIARFIYDTLGRPAAILDPAAGQCEFINAVPCREKWAVDLNDYFIKKYAEKDVKIVIGDALEVTLPENHFDAVFVSNFLEHLNSQDQVAHFLVRMFKCLKPGGKIAIMGPNFKYTYRNYFDFADHTVILSELGLAEHVYGAGFTIESTYARFLPLSFRGGLPVNKLMIRIYLNFPLAWRFLGKQFLVIGQKP